MELRILGPLEVADDGRAVVLVGARQRALLAILLLNRNEVVPSDRLMEHLYGAEQPATAAKSLQAHVSRLRKVVTPERLLTRGTGYIARSPSRDEVDAERFSLLLDAGRAALADGDPAAGERSSVDALALWRGSPLDDLAYDDFAQSEIARLEELRLACIEELNDARLALGRHAEVVGELERLVAAEPLRERLRGQLMLALYRCGRQADALAAYQPTHAARSATSSGSTRAGRCRSSSARSSNQDPALDPVLRAARRRRRTPTSEAGASPQALFVGRERELVAARRCRSPTRGRDEGRLVLLAGEAGIGKSRLADELASRARVTRRPRPLGSLLGGGRRARLLAVGAGAADVRAGLRPRRAARAARARRAPTSRTCSPSSATLFPDLPEPPSLDSDGARFRLFDSTAAFLRRAAASRRSLVVLDDVHAADAPRCSARVRRRRARRRADARAGGLPRPGARPGRPDRRCARRVWRGTPGRAHHACRPDASPMSPRSSSRARTSSPPRAS